MDRPTVNLIVLLVFAVVQSACQGDSQITNSAASGINTPMEPDFAEPIQNQTVSTGRKVILSCVVDNLSSYRVAWLYVEKYTLLTLSKTVITHNNRFKVTHNGHRTWNLVISDVQEKDKGAYMCQINTSPMKYQVGYLDVVVPPSIKEEETSSDTDVKEGSDVSLFCAAKGIPEPTLQWRREDDQEMQLDQFKTNAVKGPWLNISKVSRLHMAAYLCIASNNVPPSVSKRIKLDVQFAPMVWITDQLLGQSVGSSVRLACNLECHPRGLAYWTRNGEIISNGSAGGRFLDEIHPLGPYKHIMYLEIRNILPEDFGEYHCVAKNPLGETEGTIKVYERTRKPTPGVFDPDTITNDLFPPNDRVLSSYNSVANPICRSNNIFILAVVGYFLL
ncbi:lachesin-like isoform X2 [Varroa destructor]|uniref:Ig-like domain-containing protein n=1 Tax=Varroa destructor TaxID=109461 RepID=A0A7M7KCM4_VARDE|nr:lachesin-like isoform X2 [Varroa destructor]